MPKRSKKHRLKQVRFQQKKKLRTEELESTEGTPQVGPSTSQQEPAPPPEQPEICPLPVTLPEVESEEELTYTSQSSSIPEEVYEDSETQTSEVLPYYPEKPEEETKPDDESYPSFKALAEALGPLHLEEIKPGPDRPEITESKPASPKPSTSSQAYGEETEKTYEAVVTQTETLSGAISAKRPRLKETKVYKITRSIPGTLSLNEYSFQHLNVKNYEQVVIGVPRGIAFQYYNCKELFLSINQIDLYIIEKKGSDEQEIANPHHTHVHFPGEVYMCKQTNKEAKFSKSHLTAQVKKNVTHVHIKSIEDVIAPLHPGYTRLPQYIFVKSPPFAKTQPSFPAQPSDLLYPSEFFEMVISAYENISPELEQTFSYFRMIPGNFDVLLGVPKNALYEEYHCYPKITLLSGVDLYFVGKERVDPNSDNVFKTKSNIHTHIQFPHGIRACMFKNTPTKYLLKTSCPHEVEVKSFVHVPTSAVSATKTSMKTASLLKTAPESGSTETSAMEEETEASRISSESESSSSSSSAGKPNCYLELLEPKEGTVFIGLPKEALCHHNPETNELEALTGVGIYFIKDSGLEVCPKASAIASPHHVHLNFNTDAYLCRFEGDTRVYETEEICTRLSVPATKITAPSLNVLPQGKPIRPTVAGRSRSEHKQKSEILKTNPFAIGEKEKSSRPTLVPIMHDVSSKSLFGGIKTSGGFTPKSTSHSSKKVILKRREPKVAVTTESLPTTSSAPIDSPHVESPQVQQLAAMLFKMIQIMFAGRPMDPGLREYLEFIYRELPKTSTSPTLSVIPTTTTSCAMQISPELTEMQPSVALPEIQPILDALQMQSTSDSLQMQRSPDLFPMQPSPDPLQMQSGPELLQIRPSPELLPMQSSPEPLEMQPCPDPLQMQSAPELLQIRPSPELLPMQSSPEPLEMQPCPDPLQMQSASELLQIRPSPELLPMQSSPEPLEMQRSPDLLETQSTMGPHDIQVSMGPLEIQTGMDPQSHKDPHEMESMRMDVDTPSPQSSSSSDL